MRAGLERTPAKLEKVDEAVLDLQEIAFDQAERGDNHARLLSAGQNPPASTLPAAARKVSRSALVWAAPIKAASNCEGAR